MTAPRRRLEFPLHDTASPQRSGVCFFATDTCNARTPVLHLSLTERHRAGAWRQYVRERTVPGESQSFYGSFLRASARSVRGSKKVCNLSLTRTARLLFIDDEINILRIFNYLFC